MAGDWIKIEHVTPDKPEVMRIADDLDITENEALGGLVRFWIWCDFQSRDGHAVGVTKKALERISGVTGLYGAMIDVGWLVENDSQVDIPNFEYHLSQNAKSRALANKRQQKKRTENVTHPSRSQRDKNVTREEKRREENKNPPNPPLQGGRVAKATFGKITKRELQDPESVFSWMLKNLPPPYSENVRLKVLACAIHSIRKGKRPGWMFAGMVERGYSDQGWTVPDEDIQAASRLLNSRASEQRKEQPESIGEILRQRNDP